MKDLKIKGLEFKDGVVSLFNERIVFIPPNIISLLGQIYGEGSKPLLKYLGKKMGRRLIENWEEHLKPKNLKQLADIFVEMINMAGWGNFSITEMSENKIIFELRHNISKDYDIISSDICLFIMGFLSGFGDFALYKVKIEETKCSVLDTDNPLCLFELSKTGN